jgi:flagellar hook-basal body complex protein FliE
MATASTAANAYAALARLANPTGGGAAKPEGDGSFGTVLQQALGSVVESGRNADSQAKALAAGNANIVDVVTAVAETEVAIEALVSVRDKVIQAYEEIMRMPI